MKNPIINRTVSALLCGACLLAATTGWSAPKAVSLYAKTVYLNPETGSTSDIPGTGLIPMWGFATTPTGTATVPGPQIDVDPTQYADGLQITVFNQLTEPVSVVIPGLSASADVGQPARFNAAEASAAGDTNYVNRVRSLGPQVAAGGSRVYTWAGPLAPGTYVYHSGSHPALQVQMGLYGMVTVKQVANQAYPGITANIEVPVIFSEIDPALHAAVFAGDFGAGKSISSTLHSDPSYFLINGRAYNGAPIFSGVDLDLTPPGQVGQTTLFRMINVCWNTRIPVLGGPFPSAGGNHLTVVAEDGKPYPFAKTLTAPDLAALKTKDALFTPTVAGSYRIYDRKLGLSNGSQPVSGGMLRSWAVSPVTTPILGVSPLGLSFTATAGASNPADQTVAIANLGVGTLNWTATVAPGAAWLTATPGSGTGNGNVTAHVNLTGLAAGTYNGIINVSAAGAAGSPQAVTVTLVVNPGATIPTIVSINPQSSSGITGTAHVLTGVPAGALLVITTMDEAAQRNATVGSTPSLTWTKQVDASAANRGDAEIWTAVFPAGGSITVTSIWPVITGHLTSTMQSSVCYVITGQEPTLGGANAVSTASGAPSVAITTTRANSLLLCVSSDFAARDGATRTYRDGASEALYYRFTRSASSGATAYHYYKTLATLGAHTEGLTAPGSQQAGTCVLEVRGTAGPPTPILVLGSSSLNFSATTTGANPADQNLGISNGDGGTLNWTATVSAGATWLTATPGNGTGNGNVTVHVNKTGLTAGTYNGTITVSAPGAIGSPQTVNVSLTVTVSGSIPTIVSIDRQSGDVAGTSHVLTGVPAGALLVLTTQNEEASQEAIVSSTPSLTWVKQVDNTSPAGAQGGSGDAEIWTAVFTAGGNITVNSAWPTPAPGSGSTHIGTSAQSSVCYVVTGQETTLAGATALQNNQGAPSVTATTTRVNSLLICVSSDFLARDGGTAPGSGRTYRDGASEASYYRLSVGTRGTTGYHYYKALNTLGAHVEGLTVPTGQSAGSCVLEIRGTP